MKRYFIPLILASLALNSAFGTDLQSGESFSDGQTVTGARLNNAVNGATILPGLISGKSLVAPVAADSFLFYQAGSGNLERATLAYLQTAISATMTFTGATTISESFLVTGIISPTQIAANTDNYNPTGLSTATTLRLSTDASRNLTSIAGGASGRILILHNVGSFNLVLKDDDGATGTAANRLALVRDIYLQPDMVVVLQYDSTAARWRAIGERLNANPSYVTLSDAATITVTCDPTKIVQNSKVTLGGNRQLIFDSSCTAGMSGEIRVTQDGTGSRKLALPGPTFSDGVSTNTSTTFTSATATFATTDTGRIISEPGAGHIPSGTTMTYVNSTTVTLSAAATATGTAETIYLPGRTSKAIGGGAGAITLTTTAAAMDILTWSYDGTSIVWAKGLNAN